MRWLVAAVFGFLEPRRSMTASGKSSWGILRSPYAASCLSQEHRASLAAVKATHVSEGACVWSEHWHDGVGSNLGRFPRGRASRPANRRDRSTGRILIFPQRTGSQTGKSESRLRTVMRTQWQHCRALMLGGLAGGRLKPHGDTELGVCGELLATRRCCVSTAPS